MHRKKILFLTSRFPYPPVGGEKLKNLNLLKILSKEYDISLVALSEGVVPKEHLVEISKYAGEIKVYVKPKWQMLLAALKTLFNSLPLQVNYFYFHDVQKYINEKSKTTDLVFSTLIRTALYTKNIKNKKVLDMADSIGLNYKNSAQKSSSWFWKLIYTFEYKRLLKFEKKMIEAFDQTLFFNQAEKEFFSSVKTTWIPHGVNEGLLKYENKSEEFAQAISFLGKMDYQPNIDAVLWIAKEVMPKLNKNIMFYIVGASPTEEVKKLATENPQIKVTGFVDDPYLILKSSLCVLAPMQTGGGIQNKVLEAMAVGQTVIVSSLCARPIIGAQDQEEFLIIDEPQGIADLVNEISEKKLKGEESQVVVKISSQARRFIANNFTWTAYERVLFETLKKII